jgi:hypothetical protein
MSIDKNKIVALLITPSSLIPRSRNGRMKDAKMRSIF